MMNTIPKNPTRTKGKVTIAIGFISKSAQPDKGHIMFACDSQMTYGSGPKDLSAQKLSVICFQNLKVLMTHSGMVGPGARVIKNIERRAANVRVETWETVAKVIQESVLEVKKSLLAAWDFTEERQLSYLRGDEWTEFLVAFYLHNQPFLFHIDIVRCLIHPTDIPDYSAIGIGNDLATYLLTEYRAADPQFRYSDQLAVSVIETVKKNVKDCGGQTRVGMVYPSMIPDFESQVFIYPDALVNSIVHELRLQEVELQSTKIAQMKAHIDRMNKFMEEQAKNPDLEIKLHL